MKETNKFIAMWYQQGFCAMTFVNVLCKYQAVRYDCSASLFQVGTFPDDQLLPAAGPVPRVK